MKPTIRNKLLGGFTGVLILMSLVAGTGCYAVFTLQKSAKDAVRIGAQLNSIALEIQVHNLEAQRRILSFLSPGASDGGQANSQALEEAQFEIQEIQHLAGRAVKIASNAPTRAKFQRVEQGLEVYQSALDVAVAAAKLNPKSGAAQAAIAAYDSAADRLHESAEDGEVAGREAAQLSQEEIQSTSSRSVMLVLVFSALGLILGIAVCITLARAILLPVEHLREVADNVSLGNLDIAVRRYSNDEIGDLADSFSRMVTAVKFFKLDSEDALQNSAPPVSAEPVGLPKPS